jgi:hypothetical protein
MVMVRRVIGGAEGRKIAKESKHANKRAKNTKDQRRMVIIACEDKVSAPLYFKAIFADLIKNRTIAASSFVIAKHKNTHPTGVLQDLLDHQGWQEFNNKWIVIDRDEERTNSGGHSPEDFNNAINKAKIKNIEVAYSNPCFEIWYLLHFSYMNKAIDRTVLERYLRRTYHYKKSELFNLVLDESLQKTAIENSKCLMQSWINNQGTTIPATDNPSTTVHQLIELLNEFKTTTKKGKT